ncbi:protein phosphatase CheZ [Thiomicrorhabdus sp. zzn3]|uniref:protein phosphatase CheZ n=1 Tax=Thiomicrorhabdus sp. zzn3 TaxID=3039775 RepID=UPI0024364DE5|nr:protein phosphatase CheZ [Thiomicrorhabdus sp. zzn3]MDG6777654.1 protein phosphatase CheZ [Thiomicrorhabdus sp. zzn3]
MTFSTDIHVDKVRALLQAMEAGDERCTVEILDDITQIRKSELHQQLSELTKNLHQTLDDLDVDTPVLLHAKHDLPDITERLQYVLNETQKASDKTLGSSENTLGLLEEVGTMLEGSDEVSKIQPLLDQASQELTNIMLAQSFQDLTGQVLNRVILIVTELEESLKALIERSRHDYDAIPQKTQSEAEQSAEHEKGVGPNVTAKSKLDAVESQADVDDLLSDLGI